MEYLDEVDEHAAQQIGAVNTVVFACGSAIGYNTDWLGVRKPLVGLKGAKAVLLGAGGVASAAAYALVDLDMDVTILNRTPENAKALAERFGCRWAAWDAFDSIQPDLVVNATPLGMEPDTRSPLAEEQLYPEHDGLRPRLHPADHPAHRGGAGKRVHNHHRAPSMFIEQAREQFYLWFGIDVPAEVTQEVHPMNTFGRNFRITTFGESHGAGGRRCHRRLPAGLRTGRERHPAAARPAPPGHLPARLGPRRNRTRSRSSPESLKGRPPARPSR